MALGRVVAWSLAILPLVGGVPRAEVEAAEAKFLLAWGTKGDGPGEFYAPIGIAIDAKDEVYVNDMNNARLQEADAGNQRIQKFEIPDP